MGGTSPVEDVLSETPRNKQSRNTISPRGWSIMFVDGGGERIVKY